MINYSIVYSDGIPAGVFGLYSLDSEPEILFMGWLGIDPAFRRTGVSTFIMDFCKAEAKNKGFKRLGAFTEDDETNNRIAQKYYEKHGFTKTKTFDRYGEIERQYEIEI